MSTADDTPKAMDTTPSLCASGCGFFGNPNTANMSKCYGTRPPSAQRSAPVAAALVAAPSAPVAPSPAVTLAAPAAEASVTPAVAPPSRGDPPRRRRRHSPRPPPKRR